MYVDIRCMDMCICIYVQMYIHMYGCTTIWSESQRRKLFDGHWWWYVRCCAPSEHREGGWELGLCVPVHIEKGMGEGLVDVVQLTHFSWPAKLLTSCLASNVDNPMEHLVGSVRFKCFMNLFQWSQTRCVRVRAYHTNTNIQTYHTYVHTFIHMYVHMSVCIRRWHVATEAMSTLNLTCRRGLAPICSSVRLSPSSVRPSLSEALKLLIWFSFKCGLRTPSPPHPFPSPYTCVCVWDYVHIEQVCETGRRNYGKFVLRSALLVALNLSCCLCYAFASAAAAARAATLRPGHTLRSNERASSTHLN